MVVGAAEGARGSGLGGMALGRRGQGGRWHSGVAEGRRSAAAEGRRRRGGRVLEEEARSGG